MFRISKKVVARHIICAMLLSAAAFAINHSATLAWGGAWSSADTRYKVSPLGISHVLQPRQTVSPTVWSGWNPETGDPNLRAVASGGEGAYFRLRLIYPALQLAFWLVLAGAVLALIPFQRLRSRLLIAVFSGVSAFMVVAAVVLFVTSASRALAVLHPLDFGYGGTFGCMLAGVAPLLIAGAMGLFLPRLRWFPFLGLLAFNLFVWQQSLLFLIPIAVIIFFVVSLFGSRNSNDGLTGATYDMAS